MAPLLLYLLKANAVLALGAAAYFGLLRRLTFFQLNRAYLLLALLFAAVCPALPLPALFAATPSGPLALTVLGTAPPKVAAGTLAGAFDWQTPLLALYGTGVAVLLVRLLLQLLAMRRLHQAAAPSMAQGQPFRALAAPASPFSFWQTIYAHPAQHPAAELAAVLRHEQGHVRQWHTLDVLLAQLVLALAWCNPAAWALRRAVLDNLEYLADYHALRTGLDRRAYQYSLLRLSHGAAGPPLVSPFTFSTLKNRVAMMNTPASSAGQLVRYFVAGPLVLALSLSFAAQAQGVGPPPPLAATATGKLPANAAYHIDGKLSDLAAVGAVDATSMASMSIINERDHMRKAFGDVAGDAVIVVTTKANATLPAAIALNDKIARAAPAVAADRTEEPVAVSYLAAPALAYITQNYPGYRLTGVSRVTIAATKRVLYKAQIAVGRRPQDLLFDEKGQHVTE
ncbi:MAG: hypothetical protein H7Z21_16520 [Hymenobacter sp.]|nr:hypothetical protein [Hymenobacter sp.]